MSTPGAATALRRHRTGAAGGGKRAIDLTNWHTVKMRYGASSVIILLADGERVADQLKNLPKHVEGGAVAFSSLGLLWCLPRRRDDWTVSGHEGWSA